MTLKGRGIKEGTYLYHHISKKQLGFCLNITDNKITTSDRNVKFSLDEVLTFSELVETEGSYKAVLSKSKRTKLQVKQWDIIELESGKFGLVKEFCNVAQFLNVQIFSKDDYKTQRVSPLSEFTIVEAYLIPELFSKTYFEYEKFINGERLPIAATNDLDFRKEIPLEKEIPNLSKTVLSNIVCFANDGRLNDEILKIKGLNQTKTIEILLGYNRRWIPVVRTQGKRILLDISKKEIRHHITACFERGCSDFLQTQKQMHKEISEFLNVLEMDHNNETSYTYVEHLGVYIRAV